MLCMHHSRHTPTESPSGKAEMHYPASPCRNGSHRTKFRPLQQAAPAFSQESARSDTIGITPQEHVGEVCPVMDALGIMHSRLFHATAASFERLDDGLKAGLVKVGDRKAL